MIPTGPRTKSQELAAQLPTMPAPRDPRVEPPSLAPTAIEAELRAVVGGSMAPKAEKLQALEEMVRNLKDELARSSQADIEVGEKIDAHEDRIRRIESGVQSAAGSSAKVEKFLSGFLPPKVVGGIIAAMGAIQIVFQLIQLLRGH